MTPGDGANVSGSSALTRHSIAWPVKVTSLCLNDSRSPQATRICSLTMSTPVESHVRIDSHCFSGYFVPPYYDSLLAKVIVHGGDRREAIARMERALAQMEVTGVPTTLSFHRAVLAHADFRDGRVGTRWVEERFLDRRH